MLKINLTHFLQEPNEIKRFQQTLLVMLLLDGMDQIYEPREHAHAKKAPCEGAFSCIEIKCRGKNQANIWRQCQCRQQASRSAICR